MVKYAEAYAIGLVPGEIQDEGAVQSALSRLLGTPSENIPPLYQFAPPDQYLPIGEISAEELQDKRLEYALGVAGIQSTPYTSRFYYGNGAGAHVTGYTTFIRPEDLADFQARGYASDQRIGTTGLERWGEAYMRTPCF